MAAAAAGGAETTVRFTLTITGELELAVTVKAGYVPDAAGMKDVPKVTVTVPPLVPLVGETVTQPAGCTTDHLSDPLPDLLIVTVWEDTVWPGDA